MGGLREIIDAAARAASRGEAAVMATVVKVAGSAYRRPGARMLIPEGGAPVGMVSGGCLESDLAERAQAMFGCGRAHTVVYDMRSPDDIVWGLGLGCNGEVRVLLERLEPGDPPGWLSFLDRCSLAREPAVVATVFDGAGGLEGTVGERLLLGADGTADGTIGDAKLSAALLEAARHALAQGRCAVETYETREGRAEAFVEHVPPATSLLVFGAGNDARPVARLARELGWSVTLADDRPAYATAERFPEAEAVELIRFDALDQAGFTTDAGTVVLVMTHHFLHDLELLQFLLPTDAPYVGILGPRQRTENLLKELAGRGVRPTPAQLARLHGPVGIDIGSETPEEIALAALAEIRAVLSGRDGGFLRDRRAPLHEWPR